MNQASTLDDRITQDRWLKRYYYFRAAFSVAWVATAFTAGRQSPALGAALLFCYPLWDVLANFVDASRSGGLARNGTQALNVAASTVTAAAVAWALPDMGTVLAVFGAWAIVAGLLQLGTALRRWKAHGAQWAMVLSGAQSAVAGCLFIAQSRQPAPPTLTTVAGYAGVGAFYFLVSALWLTAGALRRRQA